MLISYTHSRKEKRNRKKRKVREIKSTPTKWHNQTNEPLTSEHLRQCKKIEKKTIRKKLIEWNIYYKSFLGISSIFRDLLKCSHINTWELNSRSLLKFRAHNNAVIYPTPKDKNWISTVVYLVYKRQEVSCSGNYNSRSH